MKNEWIRKDQVLEIITAAEAVKINGLSVLDLDKNLAALEDYLFDKHCVEGDVHVNEIMQRTTVQNRKFHFFDMDGTLVRFEEELLDRDPWYEEIRGTAYFRTLRPHKRMVRYVNARLEKEPDTVYVVTTIDVPCFDLASEIERDKKAWLKRF